MIKRIKSFRVTSISVIAVIGVFLAGMLRFSLREFQSDDFHIFVHGWYQTIKANGFGIFRAAFYDYTPPYLYALFVISRAMPRISPVVAIKIPSIAADFVCAWYAWRVVRLKYQSGPAPIFAALALLFAPTVVFNGAFWGQTDMLYTAPLVAALYYVLRKEERSAWLAIGLAFSIKAQSIFMAPFLFALLLRRELLWRNVVWAPIIWLASLLPAWIAGRPIYELLTINPTQVALQTGKLTWNAPNLYKWIPREYAEMFYPAGMLFAASVAIIFVAVIYTSQVRLTPSLCIGLALASVLIMPYVLPGMHERYFFSADVVAVLFAFYVPSYCYLPLLIGMVSFLAYQPFLFKTDIVPMPYLALILLAGIVILVRWLTGMLYPVSGITTPDPETDHTV
jgi:Gpi18-like mannosyltransferase